MSKSEFWGIAIATISTAILALIILFETLTGFPAVRIFTG